MSHTSSLNEESYIRLILSDVCKEVQSFILCHISSLGFFLCQVKPQRFYFTSLLV